MLEDLKNSADITSTRIKDGARKSIILALEDPNFVMSLHFIRDLGVQFFKPLMAFFERNYGLNASEMGKQILNSRAHIYHYDKSPLLFFKNLVLQHEEISFINKSNHLSFKSMLKQL